MFNPQIILGALLAILASLGGGFYAGSDWQKTKAEAAKAEMMILHQERVEFEQAKANTLSDKLAKAEGTIVTKTIEVIKYVPKVTTGKPCLSNAAVGLLQPGSSPSNYQAASESSPESSTSFATDTDVAYWIAQANSYYDTCAERANILIDFEINKQ